jgi:transposase
MLRFEAYRFELRPNREQERKMRQGAGSARNVWYRVLAIENEEHEKAGGDESDYAALCRELTRWRTHPETAWLIESLVHTTQQALGDLEGRWSRHFEISKKPKRWEIRPSTARIGCRVNGAVRPSAAGIRRREAFTCASR